MKDDEKEKLEQADWRYIAKVIDRFCLFLFTFLILLAFLFLAINMQGSMTSTIQPSLVPCVPASSAQAAK